MTDFYLIWQYNGQVLTGNNQGTWVNDSYYFPIIYPGGLSQTYQFTLSSSALSTSTMEVVSNIKFYLDGSDLDVTIVRDMWTILGYSSNPPRPELSGGLEISFDNGNSFTRFGSSIGNKDIPSTWLSLPASATSSGIEGQIGPYDSANIILRWTIPPGATEYRLYNIHIGVDCDII